MARQIRTHLMFDGVAEEAMNFYVSLIPGSEVHDVNRYKGGDNKGKVKFASFSLAGNKFLCIDTPVEHPFDFTPAVSIFVDCETLDELQRMFDALIDGGKELMPLGN